MIYPTIKQYREAIAESHDNLSQLSCLSPVMDNTGKPYMIAGGFGVVFKMKDKDGKLFALKCFTKEQKGREEAYKKIAAELEYDDSGYMTDFKYYEKELFVDMGDDGVVEMPIVFMDWVEGATLDKYLNDSSVDMPQLVYRFSLLTRWLLNATFAHGDIKPDNIIVTPQGKLVLVDYDSMFVPSMAGEAPRDLGTPGYSHPRRSKMPFDKHIDDFPLMLILFSLKAVAVCPELKASGDRIVFSAEDLNNPAQSEVFSKLQPVLADGEAVKCYSLFLMALSQGNLEGVDDRLTHLLKPSTTKQPKNISKAPSNVEMVDLGLSVMWANMNIGATKPEEYGDYFAWGEIEPKEVYSRDTYFDTKDGGKTFSKYNVNGGKTELDDADDVAVQTWGGSWRMPTFKQLNELRSECDWEWISVNGVNGYKVKSRVNSKFIFLPAAGGRWDTYLSNVGNDVVYWSRSLSTDNSSRAYGLGFHSSSVWYNSYARRLGFSVRPVCPGLQK